LSVRPAPSALARPPAHIDPRIRARRIEVQRGMGRRRLQRLVDLGLLLAVAAGFAAALRSPLLDVDQVVLRGNEHTASELVVERSGIARGDQLMDLDLAAAGARVAELPWIDEVELHRGLDGRVDLRVTERTPVAVLGEGADAVVVDGEGRALARSSSEPDLSASLVQLAGLAERSPEPGQFLSSDAQGALDLARRLVDITPGVVLAVDAAGGIVGTPPSGIELRFGPPTQLDAKVRDLRAVLDQVDLACAAVIDVRAPGSPVLTREEGCS
jgi:cell division septal protein FtsQ